MLDAALRASPAVAGLVARLSPKPANVGPNGAAGQQVEDVARAVMATIKEEIGAAMRGVMADVSMG